MVVVKSQHQPADCAAQVSSRRRNERSGDHLDEKREGRF
jgi:hypothetical protein